MTIIDFLENNASSIGEEVSLREKDRKITWKEFNDHSNKLANWFISNNICKGDKIALISKNCLEWLPTYFAILKAGAVAVLINYNYDFNDIEHCLEISECSVIVFSKDLGDIVNLIIKKNPQIKTLVLDEECIKSTDTSYHKILMKSCSNNPNIKLLSNDLAAIYFSSGTTGHPKAILLNHKALVASAITEQKHHKQTLNDNFLLMAPLFHTGAKMHWFGSLLAGGAAVLLNNTLPDMILETVSSQKITIAFLLLPWVYDLINAVKSSDILLEKYDISSWRLMHMGAQPIPPQTIYEWKKLFPFQCVDVSYGLTESAGPGCIHLGVDDYYKTGSIGKAGFGWKAEVLINNRIATKYEVGELIVKGPGVMVGYLEESEANKKCFYNNWLRTGDMAYKDNEGYFYLVGRKNDMIISGGENIYPIPIENFIKRHPAVNDVAIIGYPSSRLGEIVVAVIELKFNVQCSKVEINRFCDGLPSYKRPRKIIFSTIPRNTTGKIDKKKLKEKIIASHQ